MTMLATSSMEPIITVEVITWLQSIAPFATEAADDNDFFKETIYQMHQHFTRNIFGTRAVKLRNVAWNSVQDGM